MCALRLTSLLTLAGQYTSPLDLTTPTEAVSILVPPNGQLYLNGTGGEQADIWFTDKRTVVAAPETIDLRQLPSAIVDAFGGNVSFTSLKEIVIFNTETAAGKNLTLSGGAMTAFGAGGNETVGPRGIFHRSSPVDGFPIIAGTGDLLTIDPGVNTIIYHIILLGVH